MQLRHVLTDDRAVSPVIGVILMVGITVAMASVIGVFVLGADATTSVPDASFRYDADMGGTDGWGDASDSSERFVVHHDGGEDVDLSHVTVQYAGADVTTLSWLSSTQPSGDTWRPGETWTLKDSNPGSGSGTDFATDEQVLVLWTSSNGETSQILESGDLP